MKETAAQTSHASPLREKPRAMGTASSARRSARKRRFIYSRLILWVFSSFRQTAREMGPGGNEMGTGVWNKHSKDFCNKIAVCSGMFLGFWIFGNIISCHSIINCTSCRDIHCNLKTHKLNWLPVSKSQKFYIYYPEMHVFPYKYFMCYRTFRTQDLIFVQMVSVHFAFIIIWRLFYRCCRSMDMENRGNWCSTVQTILI